MSDDTGDAAPSAADLAARQDRVESKLDQLLAIVGKGERTAHAAAAEHEREKLDQPSDVADEVRRQLDAKRRDDEAAAAADEAGQWRKSVETKLAELAEQPPEAPVRKVERFMGWRM